MSNPEKPTTLAEVVEQELQKIELPVDVAGEALPALPTYRDEHDAKLRVVKREVDALPAVTNAETYEQSDVLRKRIVKLRTSVDKSHKAITDPFTTLKKNVDAYLGTTPDGGLQGRFKELERRIEANLKEYDEAEANRVRERNEGRSKRLIALGMVFDGAAYKLEALVLWPADLQTMSDDAFDSWCTHTAEPVAAEAKRAQEAEDERRRAKEAEQKEENDRLQRLFAQQAEEKKKLDDDRAELDRQRKEIRDQRQAMRLKELATLGAERMVGDNFEDLVGVPGIVTSPVEALGEMNDGAWEDFSQKVREAVVVAIQSRQEAERQERTRAERADVLSGLGAKEDGAGVWTLGDATTSALQMGRLNAEMWAPVLQTFTEAAERASGPETGLPEAVMAEAQADNMGQTWIESHPQPVEIILPGIITEDPEKRTMRDVLHGAQAFHQSIGEALAVTKSAIAKQTYQRAEAAILATIDNLRGTIEKDL